MSPTVAPSQHEALALGQALARIALVDGHSSVVLQQARAPSKLLVPTPLGQAVWLCHLTFGGGVVAGDRISLEVDVGPGSAVLSATQGATKVYRDPEQRWSEQRLDAAIADGALLVQLPHPVTAYAEARYRQYSRFNCAPRRQRYLVGRAGRRSPCPRRALERRQRLPQQRTTH